MEDLVNKIVCGDCLNVLKGRKPFADLIFADPPFNIGYQYDTYHDKVHSSKYLSWTRDWMQHCCDVLKPTGSFYIAIGDDYAAHVRLIGDELKLHLRNWIIWHYTFGQQTKTKFARSHTHIFYFVKNAKTHTFNDFAVRIPSDRELIYNDKRANPKGKMPDDVWNQYSRVCGTFKERKGWHPCQMPENLLARIISVSSNPGDLVLDPFNGSGTTTWVAKLLERHYCGIDISQNYVDNAQQRLEQDSLLKRTGNFSARELYEMKRLFIEIGIERDQIIQNTKLSSIFTKQFKIRMNNDKHYSQKNIMSALMVISQ